MKLQLSEKGSYVLTEGWPTVRRLLRVSGCVRVCVSVCLCVNCRDVKCSPRIVYFVNVESV